MKMIEINWSYNDALGDTIMEKNESLYVKMIELRNQLGGKINRIICSKKWWDDFWKHTSWNDLCSMPEVFSDSLIKVARVHDMDIYTNDLPGYWVEVVCPDGIGHINIFFDEKNRLVNKNTVVRMDYEDLGYTAYAELHESKLNVIFSIFSLDGQESLLRGYIKWDGCSNWDFDGHYPLHFCSQCEAKQFGFLLANLYDWADELMPRNMIDLEGK